MSLLSSLTVDTAHLLFLLLVLLGAVVQSLSGFAMGLIVLGGSSALGLFDLRVTAAVVSIIAATNVIAAMPYNWRNVDWRSVFWIGLGMLPMIAVGVVVLEWLSQSSAGLLRQLLGIMIAGAGALLMLKPEPYATASPAGSKFCVGLASGILGGMFGAGGAPLAYLMYRQPLEVAVVRATILGVFGISTVMRLTSISFVGHYNQQTFTLAVLAVPVVFITTLLASKLAGKLADEWIRRLVFVLLILLGIHLIWT